MQSRRIECASDCKQLSFCISNWNHAASKYACSKRMCVGVWLDESESHYDAVGTKALVLGFAPSDVRLSQLDLKPLSEKPW